MAATLKGKSAVVTGGSRGIGRAIAEALLAAGANVVISGTNPDKAKRALEEMHAICPGAVETDLMLTTGADNAAASGLTYEQFREAYAQQCLTKRLNTVDGGDAAGLSGQGRDHGYDYQRGRRYCAVLTGRRRRRAAAQ